MSSTSETGHVKTISNFDLLISIAQSYGSKYNPVKTNLHLGNMQQKSILAAKSITTINELSPLYSIQSAEREQAFKPLSKLCTRIINALKVSDVIQQIIDDALTINRKIQGERATPKLTEEEKLALKEQGKEINQISTSQMSFDNRLNNFDKLIKLLKKIPQYTPNETELQTTTLTTYYEQLKTINSAANAIGVPLTNARIARNQILYTPKTGLVDTALDAKKYILSVFGATSPEYKQVSKISFKKQKI